jgi:hypothetical protein
MAKAKSAYQSRMNRNAYTIAGIGMFPGGQGFGLFVGGIGGVIFGTGGIIWCVGEIQAEAGE